MNNNRPPYSLWLAQAAWCALIALTLLWDWAFAPLHTGRALLLIARDFARAGVHLSILLYAGFGVFLRKRDALV